MNNDQIKHMADRFLAWKLPADFAPDGGISFAPTTGPEPTGTNLLNHWQASNMVRHMTEGLPGSRLAIIGHMGDCRSILEILRAEFVSHTVDRPDLGAMGATRIETWRDKHGGILELHHSNGGCSLYRVMP
jgi:hypothetical protein